MEVYFLDVGQGDCSVLLLPDQSAIVFDCADDVVLQKSLDAWGVKKITAFIASHLDVDHIGGAAQFLANWPGEVAGIYTNPDRRPSEGSVAGAFLKAVREKAASGQATELGSNSRDPRPVAADPGGSWSVRILAPRHERLWDVIESGDFEEPNLLSAVLRVQVGEKVVPSVGTRRWRAGRLSRKANDRQTHFAFPTMEVHFQTGIYPRVGMWSDCTRKAGSGGR